MQEMICGVQRILNGNRTTPNQTSPAELLFGNAIILDRWLFLPKSLINDSQIKILSWASDMLVAQDNSMKKAELLQRAKDESHMSNANPNRTEFPAGSWVLAECALTT